MLDKKSLRRIQSTVEQYETTTAPAQANPASRPDDQTFARLKLFAASGDWENVGDDKWRLVDCQEVIKTATNTWAPTTFRPLQTIWFIPEMFGADDQADPNDLLLSAWLACAWEFQSNRWIVLSSNTISQTGTTTTGDDGSFTCCQCTKSKLFLVLENAATISWSKINFPKSIVSSGEITHKIRLTCIADGSTLDVSLPVVDCETTDCQVYDLTGTSVGGCDVGRIYFGNDESCATDPNTSRTLCDPGPTNYAVNFDGSTSPPPSPWSIILSPGSFSSDGSNCSALISPVPSQAEVTLSGRYTDPKVYLESRSRYTGNVSTTYGGSGYIQAVFGSDTVSLIYDKTALELKITRTVGVGSPTTLHTESLDNSYHTFTIQQTTSTAIEISLDGSLVDTITITTANNCSTSYKTRFGSEAASAPTDPSSSYIDIDYLNTRML